MSRISAVLEDADRIGIGVILDAARESEAQHWEKRAREFLAARPRAGDYTGAATPAELAEAYDRCTAIAAACQNKAALIRDGEDDSERSAILDLVLDELAAAHG